MIEYETGNAPAITLKKGDATMKHGHARPDRSDEAAMERSSVCSAHQIGSVA